MPDKTNKMTDAPSEDSDQHGHLPSLIRLFAVRMKKHWTLNYLLSAQWRLWSDWVDAQADLSLRWAHISFCWFCRPAAQMAVTSGSNFQDSVMILSIQTDRSGQFIEVMSKEESERTLEISNWLWQKTGTNFGSLELLLVQQSGAELKSVKK